MISRLASYFNRHLFNIDKEFQFKTRLEILNVKNVFITKSLLMTNLLGITDGCIFDSFNKGMRGLCYLQASTELLKNKATVWKDDNYCFVFNLWVRGYYHWITEVAIKFVLFEQEIRNAILIVPEDPPQFVTDFLSLYGISQTRLMEGNCFVRKVKVISNPISGFPNPEHLRRLSNYLLDKTPKAADSFERIYVSRRGARHRKVLNEEEVVRMLEEEGFHCVDLEGKSLTEQVNLFRDCKTLVSIHGGALTNSIFMPAGSSMIEIYPKSEEEIAWVTPCYPRLCRALDLNHRYLFSRRGNPDSKPNFYHDNTIVDVERLKQLI